MIINLLFTFTSTNHCLSFMKSNITQCKNNKTLLCKESSIRSSPLPCLFNYTILRVHFPFHSLWNSAKYISLISSYCSHVTSLGIMCFHCTLTWMTTHFQSKISFRSSIRSGSLGSFLVSPPIWNSNWLYENYHAQISLTNIHEKHCALSYG